MRGEAENLVICFAPRGSEMVTVMILKGQPADFNVFDAGQQQDQVPL